jgi:PST family polysaccharide transporter
LSDLKAKISQGLRWTMGSQVVNQVMVLFFNLALLHWLTPDQFGIFAFPYLVFTLLRSFHDFGFSEVFIVEKDWHHTLFSSIFWLIIILAFLAGIVTFFLSPLLEDWTQKLGTGQLLKWLAFAVFLGSVQAGFDIVFRKLLLFDKLFWIEFWANLISGVSGIVLAWWGTAYYALLAKTIIYVVVLSMLSFFLAPRRPAFCLSFSLLRQHLSFATANWGDQLIQFAFKNADTFLLSRYAPSASLGLYDRAFRLLVFPVQQVGASMSKVMLPAFSNIKEDTLKLSQAFYNIWLMAAAITLPFLTLVPMVAADVVDVFFLPAWKQLSVLFSTMTLMAAAQGSFALGNPVFYIKARVGLLFRFSLISRLIPIVLLVWAIGHFDSIEKIALVFSISAFAFVLPFHWLVFRLLEIKMADLIKPMARILLACVLVLLIGIGIQYAASNLSSWLRLIITLLSSFGGVLVIIKPILLKPPVLINNDAQQPG